MFYDCNTFILPDISKWKMVNIKNDKHLFSFSSKEENISSSELFSSIKDKYNDIISNFSSDKSNNNENDVISFNEKEIFFNNNNNQEFYDKFYD